MMFLCQKCSEYAGDDVRRPEVTAATTTTTTTTTNNEKANNNNRSGVCSVCLGLWQNGNNQEGNTNDNEFYRKLKDAVVEAVKPYCDNKEDGEKAVRNFFCSSTGNSPSTMNLPGDILYRYSRYLATATTTTNKSTTTPINKPQPLTALSNDLKQYAKDTLTKVISELQRQSDNTNHNQDDDQQQEYDDYPSCVQLEQQGHLCVYAVATPSKGVVRPTHLFSNNNRGGGRRRRRQHHQQQRDEPSQGGDPRQNLELRIIQQQHNKSDTSSSTTWSINQAMTALSAEAGRGRSSSRGLQQQLPDDDDDETLLLLNTSNSSLPLLLDIHVTVWRKPFYLRGLYTKTRRDVSQSPFYANDNGKRRKLGITSVEEEILKVVTKYCNGISTLNNNPENNTNVKYGMAKFHASGREDMNVRMLLPHSDPDPTGTDLSSGEGGGRVITGRPFVCEIIDAYRMPQLKDLQLIVNDINCISSKGNEEQQQGHQQPDSEQDQEPASKDDNDVLCLYRQHRSYGCNPMGVGISPSDFKFVPSSVFKNLQADTEEKVKYYGCLCWCKDPITTLEELNRRLFGNNNNNDNNGSSDSANNNKYPLTLQQKTPLRVLHRRANTVRVRRILSLRITQRIDDHYFRLHLSSDAGTYIKEFVTGDLGRTQPNLSTILQCKTDILELDCEGIAS